MQRYFVTDATLAKRLRQVELIVDLQLGIGANASEKIKARIRTVRENLEDRAEQLDRVRKRVYGK